MLPNDPMLALREANATMAHRQYEASQERLAANAQFATNPDVAKASTVKTFLRPATIFVTVVLALSALIGASSASVPNLASKRVVAGSPITSHHLTTSRVRMFGIDPAGHTARRLTSGHRVL